MSKRIALASFHAGRTDTFSYWPHYGLTLLATILSKSDYDVRVFDQSFLQEPDDRFLERIVSFDPQILGVSLYTTHVTRSLAVTDRILDQLPSCRGVAGGPHVSLYASELADSNRFSALVCGEAESTVAQVVSSVFAGARPGIVRSEPPSGDEIPAADFRFAAMYERMQWLPIQLSRGCPFNCCFCEVHKIASRRIRYRNTDHCLDEIVRNLEYLDKVHTIRITDDCPTLSIKRFKKFLHNYINKKIKTRISIDNMRADCVDAELLDLLTQIGVSHICIAVESASPKVFEFVDKGESLEDIVRTAELVKKKNLSLYLCFVIGLPHSTFETEMESLRLAKKLKPDLIYWNMFLPHRGTRAREWFEKHGTVFDEADLFSVPDYNLRFSLPSTETPEFPRVERVRAYLKCVLETGSFIARPRTLIRALWLAYRYDLWQSIPIMLGGLPGRYLFYMKLIAGRIRARLRR